MKKIILLFSIFTFLFSEAEITNIQASQRTDGSQIVDITYDLLPDLVFEFFEIIVLVSLDGGNSWAIMSNVEGDLGDIVEPGYEEELIAIKNGDEFIIYQRKDAEKNRYSIVLDKKKNNFPGWAKYILFITLFGAGYGQ